MVKSGLSLRPDHERMIDDRVHEFLVISENGTDEIYFTCITTALLKKILIDDQISKNEVATFLHFADKYMFKTSFGKGQ